MSVRLGELTAPPRWPRVAPLLPLLICLLPLVVGCQGCREDDPDAAQRQEPTEPVTALSLDTLPSTPGGESPWAKPGHWTTLSQPWQANSEDLRGELEAASKLNSVRSDDSETVVRTTRPAVLPKGQSKRLDLRTLVPVGEISESTSLDVAMTFRSPSLPPLLDGGRSIRMMQAHEYFFVVLSDRSEQFASVQIQDWVNPPRGDGVNMGKPSYRMQFPQGQGFLPLPDTFFEWTSTAYVLWDDLRPEELTFDQRQALRDWLHWGGHLIINGPASIQALADSEFADLLPLAQPRSVALTPERLVEMVEQWSIETDESRPTIIGLLQGTDQRIGIEGTPTENVTEVPGTSGLVLEKQVGRGRVTMTGFELSAGWIVQWDSSQSFFNAALLRRPARNYITVAGAAQLNFTQPLGGRERDARLATRLRVMTRDWTPGTQGPEGSEGDEAREQAAAGDASVAVSQPARATGDQDALLSRDPSWLGPSDRFVVGASVGQWSDDSPLSRLSAELLKDEAGITIPSSRFVAKALAIYLLILIPINYVIFFLLGKLEWAWIVVPVIGLVGAAWIARSAQLDIGFARSQTEVGVLELQPGYERGLLTRYLALYNSLSTTYSLDFEDRDAVAVPMTGGRNALVGNTWFRQAFDQGVSLAGVTIPSNQTATFHSEQLQDLGGSLEWTITGSDFAGAEGQIRNATILTLYDAVVIARDRFGQVYFAYPGYIAPGATADVRLQNGVPQWTERLPLGVERIMKALTTGEDLDVGQARLVGRVEEAMPGLEMVPAVSQVESQTVVVAHLTGLELPPPKKDVNLRTDIKETDFEVIDDFGPSATPGGVPPNSDSSAGAAQGESAEGGSVESPEAPSDASSDSGDRDPASETR